jgi:plastocyanin domain-containing protein
LEVANWSVTVVSLLLIGMIAWFIWRPKKGESYAKAGPSGFQEESISVKNGYSPNRIIVQSGKPVRFNFIREEQNACSEIVIFPDFQKSATLPANKKVIIELPPMEDGKYEFTCQMGVYRGTIIANKFN